MVEQDTEPAACLASRTREAGGHRTSPLRGGADSSAATAQANGGKPPGSAARKLATARSKGRAGVRHSGPPAQNPVMARREALRWVKADVSARAHRMDYPNCASWRVIPLIFRGGNQGSPLRAANATRTARARENSPGRGCLTCGDGNDAGCRAQLSSPGLTGRSNKRRRTSCTLRALLHQRPVRRFRRQCDEWQADEIDRRQQRDRQRIAAGRSRQCADQGRAGGAENAAEGKRKA